MKRTNFLKEVRTEKVRTKQRLAELLTELADAEVEQKESQAKYDAELLAGGQSDAALCEFQKSMIKCEALKRIIEDIEKRVLPSFPDRENEAHKQSRLGFWEEMRPLHEEARKEIQAIVMMIAAKVDEYTAKTRDIEREWGAGDDYMYCFKGLEMPVSLRDVVSFKYNVIDETYKPPAGYQPILGGGSGFRPTDERASYV